MKNKAYRSPIGRVPTRENIKAMHEKQIYLAVLRSGGLSRAQLRCELGLSFPSVSSLVDELVEAGLLIESETTAKLERGRPGRVLTVSGDAFFVPVVMLTREGYEYSLFNSRAELVKSGFLPFEDAKKPRAGEYWYPDSKTLAGPLEKWYGELKKYRLAPDLVYLLAGNPNSDGRLSSSGLRIAAGAGTVSDLSSAVSVGIVFMNNSDCFAYAEKQFCDCPDDFVCIFVGSGVGAGIIRDGKVFGEGKDVRAGEIGHASIDHNGRICECGSRGCLERYISTDVITAEARELIGDTDFMGVCREYRKGNPGITALINDKARLLTFGIANMLTLQPVTRVVLGGGIEALGDGFLVAVHENLRTVGLRRYAERVTVTFTKNQSGDILSGALWNYLEHKLKMEKLYT